MIPEQWLGVDVGWVYPAVDSDGVTYRWPGPPRQREQLLIPAGPVTIRQPDGTVIVRDAHDPEYLKSQAAEIRVRRRVETVAGSVVATAEGSGRGIALEDWTGFAKRKAAWIRVYQAIANRADYRRVPITQVNRAYTSITCPRCDYRSRANRRDRNTFACVQCGFVGQADHVAALNIARRAQGTFAMQTGECSVEGCDSPVWRKGLCIWCYRFQYRRGRLPTKADFEERDDQPSQKAYREAMRRRFLDERRESREQATEERKRESYRTHDAWGNPVAQESSAEEA